MRRGRAWALAAAVALVASVAGAQTPITTEQALRQGEAALQHGAVRDALEIYEAYADHGAPHPDVSYSRGVAYLTRAREGAEQPGDLGKAAAAFEETLLLRPDDAAADAALDAVRAEVARRRSRRGASLEVAVSPGALRALAGVMSENAWALVALGGALALALGLALRRAHGVARLVSGVAVVLGALALVTAAPLTAYARYLRRDVGVGVVVVDEARLVDERAVPVGAEGIPEAARVDVLERRGSLLRVRWGRVAGLVPATSLRLVSSNRF
ncbi:MAG: hypothetical protein EOO75_10730 [Myxococcales bacterium]|nr:MAG: hypothetical protein EOO75_10730 [Myxococcales bacterium]